MATGRPHVVLCSLEKQDWFDGAYASLIEALNAKADISRIVDSSAFLQPIKLLLLATDAALSTSYFEYELHVLVTNVRDHGATVIFGCTFANFARPADLGLCFAAFGLPWQSGDYHRAESNRNNSCMSLSRVEKNKLVHRYVQTALNLRYVRREDAVYLPIASMGPEPDEVCMQVPAALAKVGRGWVGYLGDVNAEVESEAVVMAMLSLL